MLGNFKHSNIILQHYFVGNHTTLHWSFVKQIFCSKLYLYIDFYNTFCYDILVVLYIRHQFLFSIFWIVEIFLCENFFSEYHDLCVKILWQNILKYLQWPKIETLLCIPYVPAAPWISVDVLKLAFYHSVTWNISDFIGQDR